MTPRNERHQVSSGRASEAAAGRLRGALRREVGDLEVRLEEAQLRSSAFLSAGLDREAAEVLEESRAMVDAFHRRLESSLAEAAVEREAERIFAGADDVVDVLGGDPEHAGGLMARIPAGIGAAVASLAVLAMAVVSMRAPESRDLQTVSDVAALPVPSASDDEAAAPRTYSARVTAMAASMSPAELEVLAGAPEPEAVAPLLERRRKLLNRLAAGAQPISSTMLAELDSLVAQLRTEGVDVDRLMLLERVVKYRAAEEGRQGPASEERSDAPQPEQPQEPAPAPEQEPEPQDPEASEESEEDPTVFPFGEEEPQDEETEPSEGGRAGAQGSGSDEKSDGDGGILD